jgi:hypothetical protein
MRTVSSTFACSRRRARDPPCSCLESANGRPSIFCKSAYRRQYGHRRLVGSRARLGCLRALLSRRRRLGGSMALVRLSGFLRIRLGRRRWMLERGVVEKNRYDNCRNSEDGPFASNRPEFSSIAGLRKRLPKTIIFDFSPSRRRGCNPRAMRLPHTAIPIAGGCPSNA